MLEKEECLQLLAKHRTDEVVVTTMGLTVPWAKLSTHPLDYASVGSAMGHAADFALGIALAKPEKEVIVLNGDGSMLMCLGTLATITGLSAPPSNYTLFVCDNGTYEVTGNQPVPGNRGFSWTTIAKGVGFQQVYEFAEADALDAALPEILKRGAVGNRAYGVGGGGAATNRAYGSDGGGAVGNRAYGEENAEGPVFVNLKIAQAAEPPPDRWGGFPYPYLQESLAESTDKLRRALAKEC